jgi:ribosomal protein S18 acetylase RimI-like enzyme
LSDILHATVELAARIERAEIAFCAAAAGEDTVASLDAGGGRALFAVAGSPLNKVLGLGVGAPVSDADLDAIEAFYRSHAAHVRLELCPLSPADLPARLSARGYVLQEFENELCRRLPVSDEELRAGDGQVASGLRVARAAGGENEMWVRAVAEGFAAGDADTDAPAAAVDQAADIMRVFMKPFINRYLVRAGEAIAGGAATFAHDRTFGIFATATSPRFRRRGVQSALVAQALRDAEGRAEFAIATTAPGTTSQRTFERFGFRVVYTRAIMVLPLQSA